LGVIRKDPAYRLTRDGFTLLAMGFTGKRALQFKLAYIDAFNKMEAELHDHFADASKMVGTSPAQSDFAFHTAMDVAVNIAQYVFKAEQAGEDWTSARFMVGFDELGTGKCWCKPVTEDDTSA
jgi:phage regulator Rha-like protein